MHARLTVSLLTVAVMVVAVLASGCGDGEVTAGTSASPSSASLTRVETLEISPGPFADAIELTGSVEALNDATLSAQASGTIVMLLDRGTRVSAGARVAQIDAREERASVEQSQAQFDLAEDRLERQRPLYQDSIISAIEFEQIKSEYNRSKAALQEARERLAKMRVTTPFAGTIEERFVEKGEQVSPGMQVARVVSTRRVRVRAGVPERYANDIRLGTPVQLDFRRYGGEVRTANVTFVGRAIQPDTRTFPIEVEIDNADGRLKPEMVAALSVTRSEVDDALVVPRTAVVRDELGTHLFIANPVDSVAVAEKRDIVLGPSYGEKAVVRSGLTAGEQVIVAGQTNVAPGDTVDVTAVYQSLDASGQPYEGPDTESLNPESLDTDANRGNAPGANVPGGDASDIPDPAAPASSAGDASSASGA